jgi:hypothetical protein
MNARSLRLLSFPLLLLAACASGGYGARRLADLREVAHVSVGSGKGLAVDATLGFLSQPSLGLYGAKTVSVGVLGRDVQGFIAETQVSAPYAYRFARQNGWGLLEALNFSGWRAQYAVGGVQRGFEEVDKPLKPVAPREFGRVVGGQRFGGELHGGRWLPLPSAAAQFSPLFDFDTATELGAGAHVAIFAARIGVNPLEFADFLLGFAGLDIGRDDGARSYSAVAEDRASAD